MGKQLSFYNKHKQVILYFTFRIITTIASFAACYLTLKIGVLFIHDENGEPTELLDILASTTQWIVGVIVAFVTNKIWVFTNAEKGAHSTFSQLLKFSSSRIATYFLEVVINLLGIYALERIGYQAFAVLGLEISARVWAKLFAAVIVVITNYYISKFFIFKEKSTNKKGDIIFKFNQDFITYKYHK